METTPANPVCSNPKANIMAKNILFITADQWRGECLSRNGHMVATPNLDKLAREGVTFTRHYANAVPCGPSRACIHTGMYLQNHRSGTNGTPLDSRHTNWALELRQAGYDPVVFGYTDTANDPRDFADDDPVLKSYEGPLPGITHMDSMGTFPDSWADWLAEKGYHIPSPNWRLYTDKKNQPEYEEGGKAPAPLAIPAEHHDTHFMIDEAVDYLNTAPQNWCIHLSLMRPHPPWVAPSPYNEMYPPDQVPDFVRSDSREEEATQHPFLNHALKKRRVAAPEDDNKMRRLKSTYYGLMSEVDHNLGRLFDYLKSTDQFQHTLIVFTSDHGEQLGDHWLLGKLGYFDQSYHIPLIIYNPMTESAGTTVDEFTENVDIMPTLLDWIGLDIPVQCDGRSLLAPSCSGTMPSNWRTEAHWEFDFRDVIHGEEMEDALNLTLHQCSLNVIRDKHYKYVHFTNLPALLFDLEKDPDELINQVDNPDYQEIVLRFAQKMLSWRMNHDEQLLTHLTLNQDGVKARPSPRYR